MGEFLRGAEKYLTAAQQKQNELRGLSKTEQMIARANAVSIFDVLEDYFNLTLPREGASFKSRCPFSYEHADGGLDKGFRTYPASNSSMCFPLHGYMPPVRLVSMKFGEKSGKSARRILDYYGLLKPKHWRDRFEGLVSEVETRDQVGNPQHAVEALTMALKANKRYLRRQYDPDVQEAMSQTLDLLDRVVSENRPDLMRRWYEASLLTMMETIRLGEMQNEAY